MALPLFYEVEHLGLQSLNFPPCRNHYSPIGLSYELSVFAFVPVAHRSLDLALRISLGQGFALVVELLALGNRYLQLGPSPYKVQFQRYQRQPLHLDFPPEVLYLVTMEE